MLLCCFCIVVSVLTPHIQYYNAVHILAASNCFGFGNMSRRLRGIILIMTGGNILIMAGGSISIMAGGNILIMTGGNILIMTGGNILIMAGANILMMAGGHILIMAGGDILIMAGGNILIMAEGHNDETAVRFALTKDTPYIALTDELWGVIHELYENKWRRYIASALHFFETATRKNTWVCAKYPMSSA